MFFVIFYLVYFNALFLIFARTIYSNFLIIFPIIIYFIFIAIDTLLRPLTEKKDRDKSSLLVLLLHILNPICLILGYYENKWIISIYIGFYDNLIVWTMGLIILILGGIILVISRFQLGKFGSGKLVIEDEHKLIQEGIYIYIRHPMYSGGIVVFIGFTLIFRCLITIPIYLILYIIIMIHRINIEEKILIEEFGSAYEEYKKSSYRLIPFIY